MRMTRTLTEDLCRALIHARPDWPDTAVWVTCSRLERSHERSFPEIFMAAMHCANNPLISDPAVILLDGPHWDNIHGYLTVGAQGKRFRSAQAQQVLTRAADDHQKIRPQQSHRDMYVTALADAKAARAS